MTKLQTIGVFIDLFKELAFLTKERDAHSLCGLLPPTFSSQQLQENKLMNNISLYQVPLQKYVAMMDLHV
ncbi:hypothetical protein AAZX31_02G161600 [Glycine max]